MTRRLLLAIALFSLGFDARADDTADEAEFRFRRGAEHYAKGRTEEALSEFFASNRLAKNRNVSFNIARCFDQLGRSDEAFRWYHDLLSEPWKLEERTRLDEAIAKLKPRVALVAVTTNPPGAEVFVERVDLGSRGTAPRTLALSPGRTKVLARLPGFRPAEAEVTLEAGKEANVAITLERIWGHVDVEATPAGAIAQASGDTTTCAAPCPVRVLPGRRTIVVSAPGFVELRREVDVAPDARVPLVVVLDPLPPPTGKLVVRANKGNALLRINGVAEGFTPVVRAVPVGHHVVEVSLEQFETFRTEVEITEGTSLEIDARLHVPAPKVSAAAKSLASADDTAASVTVIEADEIRAMGWQTLAQALRGVRGLFLTNDRTYDYVGVRGFQPPGDFNTRVLVLVDGHPYNDVWVGQAGIGTDFDVDLSQVERIEVVRGPNSALYGSAAVFGVVNVVHRSAPREGNVELLATGGNQGLARGRATAGFERERYGATVSVAGLVADNADTTLLALPSDAQPAVVRGLDGEQGKHLSLFGHAGGFRLVAALNDRTKEIPTAPFDTILGRAGTRARDSRAFVEGRFDHAFANGNEVTARAYYDATRFDGNFVYGDGTTREDNGADWTGGELRWRSAPLAGHRLTAGAEVQRWLSVQQRITAGTATILDTGHTATVISGYALDDWRIHSRLKAEVALRADMYTGAIEELAIAPRAALVAQPYADGLSKLMFGRAFRVPNIYERFYNDGSISQKSPAPGSLRPEEVYSVEIEHRHRVHADVQATGSVFASRLSHVLRLGTDADSLLVYANGTKPVTALGAEMELRWQPSRLQLVSFAYSFQWSRDPEASGTALQNSPAHLASLRAMTPLAGPVRGGFEAVWGSPRLGRDGRRSGEALLVSASLSGDLKPGWTAALSVQNLLDEQYSFPAGDEIAAPVVPQYGRTVQMTLGKSF